MNESLQQVVNGFPTSVRKHRLTESDKIGRKRKTQRVAETVKRFPTVSEQGEQEVRELSEAGVRKKTLTEGGVEKETESAIKDELKWRERRGKQQDDSA